MRYLIAAEFETFDVGEPGPANPTARYLTRAPVSSAQTSSKANDLMLSCGGQHRLKYMTRSIWSSSS